MYKINSMKDLNKVLQEQIQSVMYSNVTAVKPIIHCFVSTLKASTTLTQKEINEVLKSKLKLDKEAAKVIQEYMKNDKK